jgi:hypothetical protein
MRTYSEMEICRSITPSRYTISWYSLPSEAICCTAGCSARVIENPEIVFNSGVGYDSKAIYESLHGQVGLQ